MKGLMHTGYYKGCRIVLRHGQDARDLLLRVRKRVEVEYDGAEIAIEGGAPPKEVEVGEVFVPNAHSLSTAGEVDQRGRLIRPMSGELILRHVMEIIREEETPPEMPDSTSKLAP